VEVTDGTTESAVIIEYDVPDCWLWNTREYTRLHKASVDVDIEVALEASNGYSEPALERHVLNTASKRVTCGIRSRS
jgi:hypothetical protein